MARGKRPRTMAKFCQVDGSRTLLVWLVGERVWRAYMGCAATAGPALYSSGSAAHSRPHPGLYRPKNADNSEDPTVRASVSGPRHTHFRTHELAPCCTYVFHISCLPGQCGKQGPCVSALHRLRPRRSSKRYQCNSLQSLGRTPAL